LKDKHREVDCAKCHVAGKRWREASSDCNACHGKDDAHKGGLGVKCADCHTERRWKDVDFDHGKKTRFALSAKHAEAKCDDCHAKGIYKDTPRTCIGCHKKDDEHKGRYGDKCESCHAIKAWKPPTFSHDVDTRYVLKGKHRSAKCGDCHAGPLYRVKLKQECVECHRKDDKHKETLGRDCAACHTESSWKEPPGFNHAKTNFPLVGGHVKAACKDCHADALYRKTPGQCIACHKKDDKHESTLGERCSDCHYEKDWKSVAGRFDHQRTRFALRNAHAGTAVKCVDCHADLRSLRNTATGCISCHRKDDKHDATLGERCEQCHGDVNWRVGRFDHAKTRFALVGRHLVTTCNACHRTHRFKDAARECIGCHRADDKHKGSLGTNCSTCHNERSWLLWDFDHDAKTHFALQGAHRSARCAACHVQPAPAGKLIERVGSDCLSCHRREDVHEGRFGRRCEQCHAPTEWRRVHGAGDQRRS
jgi:hypothetical protein